jgi:hypothetical protein
MLSKYSDSAQANIKKHLTTIVKLRFEAKSRLRTEGREDEQLKQMTNLQFQYKNLVKKYVKSEKDFGELLKLWQVRTNIRNDYLTMNEMKPILERCIKKKGGKRKRKTKRKRRKKKKSTRRKRRKRRR